MAFLVVGGTGNVGSAAVQKLSESGSGGVKVLTRTSTSAKAESLKSLANVEIVEGSVMDKASLTKAFDGVKTVFIAMGNYKEQVE